MYLKWFAMEVEDFCNTISVFGFIYLLVCNKKVDIKFSVHHTVK
jgi:hypothetical protein